LSDRRAFIFLSATGALAACGFTPLYGDNTAANALEGQISVAQIDGRMGFALRKRLTDRLGAATDPAYSLKITLDVDSVGLSISEQNDITRYNLTGRANYVLRRGNSLVDSATVRAFAAYSATNSPFATDAALIDARDRLATSLADRIVTRILAGASNAGS
jgi:LPS-assembly lipoprotein